MEFKNLLFRHIIFIYCYVILCYTYYYHKVLMRKQFINCTAIKSKNSIITSNSNRFVIRSDIAYCSLLVWKYFVIE